MAKHDKRAEIERDGERRWTVSLPGNPERVVTAADEAAAVSAYRREMGIVATEHEFSVAAM